MMAGMDLLPYVYLVGLLVPAVVVAVIAIILVAGKPRPRPGLGPRTEPVAGAPTGGRWNMQVLSSGAIGSLGGALGSTTGEAVVDQGWLHFLVPGSGAPQWRYPCAQLTVRAHSAWSTAGVVLWTPDGEVRCNVSREHINLVSRNTIKTLREPRYYREFADVLAANGARRV